MPSKLAPPPTELSDEAKDWLVAFFLRVADRIEKKATGQNTTQGKAA